MPSAAARSGLARHALGGGLIALLAALVVVACTQASKPGVPVADLMKHIKGPDFPTGGLILGRDGIREAYHTGRGRIRMRARTKIEQMQGGRYRIVVTEIPYMVNKANLVEKIAELHREKHDQQDAEPEARHGDPEKGPGGRKPVEPTVAAHGSDARIIDVREPDEFVGPLGHIAGAELVPLHRLAASVAAIPRDKPIVTVCRSGGRSAQAFVLLRRAGVDRVANLAGGMLRWHEYGLPVSHQG